MIKKLKYVDKTLFIITIILFILGLIMVFSASNVTAYMSHAVSPYKYFFRQLLFLGLGLFLSIIMITFNTKFYGMLSRLLLIGNVVALVALLLYGSTKNQAVSWFQIGQFTIQPSEFVKIISIVYLAEYYDIYKNKLDGWVRCLFPILVCAGISILIFIQPDLGTTLIYIGIVGLMFLAVPMSKEVKSKVLFVIFGLGVIGAIALFSVGKNILAERQIERFDIKNPCSKILDNGNQVCNCYIAMNNGGLLGVGLGNSTQKYLYLPEPYTDFIFAIIVEELGVVTGIIIILLYIIVLLRIINIGRRSSSNRGALLCYGIAIYIFLHIAVNLLGIMGLIPMTGVPLPFMSYGGSFTICLIAALTIVQRVSIDNGLIREKSGKNA